MSKVKPTPVSPSFPLSEQELKKRMDAAKPLSKKEFLERVKQIQSGS